MQTLSSTASPSAHQLRITTCKTELQQLIQQKREQCNAERLAKQMMENAEWESKPPPPGKPQPTGVITHKKKKKFEAKHNHFKGKMQKIRRRGNY